MKTKHQLLQEWNESTYGLEFGDYVYQYFTSEFNKPPVYGQRVIDEIEQLRKMANHAPDNEYKAGFLKAITNVKAIIDEYLPPSPGSVDVEEKKEGDKGLRFILEKVRESRDKNGVDLYHARKAIDMVKQKLQEVVDDEHLDTGIRNYCALIVGGLGDSSGSEKESGPVSGIAMQKAIEFVRTYPTGNTFDYRMGFEAGHEHAISKKSVKDVSREGEKEIAELHEKLEEITFYEEEARRQIGIRDQLLEDIFYNRLKPEVIKHKIDQILNLPF